MTRSPLVLIILLAMAATSTLFPVRGQALQPHDPIIINGNNGFTSCQCLAGGNGTAASPYIIENWEITTVTPPPRAGISITNTRSHFVIRNVYIHPDPAISDTSGIYLVNVENGRIEDSRLASLSYGIWMSLGNRNVISNNTVSEFTKTGLNLLGGSENMITSNTISSIYPGIGAPLLTDLLTRYFDNNTDNTWTPRGPNRPEEPITYDSNDNNLYDTGEPVLFGPTPSDGTGLTNDPRITFFDFNNNGVWDRGDVLVYDTNQNRLYSHGEPVLTSLQGEGMRIGGLTTSLVSRNKLANLHTAFLVSNTQNTILRENQVTSATWYGFRIMAQTSTSTFANNTVTRSSAGIVFDRSSHNLAVGNLVSENVYGIGLEGLSGSNTGNTIKENIVTSNSYGIYSTNSYNNTIYNNYLQSMASNTSEDRGRNFWNTTKTLGRNILGGPFLGGNFFHDYQGTDQDGDGLGDSTYRGLDQLPLVSSQPSTVHDLAVTAVTVQPSSVSPGDTFTITVSPFNQGSVEETFTVTTFRDLTLLDTRTLTLGPWLQTSFSFTWNTGGLSSQTYAVKSNATIVPGEIDISDNTSPVAQATVNTPPTASFTITPQVPAVDQEALFDASSSTDSDGTVLSYSWDFGDGQTSSGPTARHTYASAGPYTVVLTVTDNLGGAGSTSRTITVASTLNQSPIATFSMNPATPVVRQQITFDASNSYDPDGTIGQYTWDFGDEETGNGPVVTHTFSSPGVYEVRLTVTDNLGGIGFIVNEMIIRAVPPTSPIGLSITIGTDGITLTWSPPLSDGGAPVTEYRIYRGISPSTLALIATVNNALTYRDTAILRGETYIYRVSAITSAGEGELSGEVQAQVPRPTTFLLNNPFFLAGIAGLLVALIVAAAMYARARRPVPSPEKPAT